MTQCCYAGVTPGSDIPQRLAQNVPPRRTLRSFNIAALGDGLKGDDGVITSAAGRSRALRELQLLSPSKYKIKNESGTE